MSKTKVSVSDYDAPGVLIDCMEKTPPLSHEEIVGLSANQRAVIERMLASDETWNQASSGSAFLSLSEGEFRHHLKTIDNNLGEQTAIVADAFSNYLKMGEVTAPYYPIYAFDPNLTASLTSAEAHASQISSSPSGVRFGWSPLISR